MRGAAGAALALPILVLCAPFLFSGDCLYGIDFKAYYRPHYAIARDALQKDGELPRWNPYQYAGTPYLGNAQATFLYPPTWLFVALPLEEGFEVFVALHLLLAAWGAYRLARHFRLGRPAAVAAGLAWALSSAVLARVHAGHVTIQATLCQAPALLWLVLAAAQRPSFARVAALAAMTGLVLVSGHPQFVYQLALLCAAAATWAIVRRRREGWDRPASAVVGAVAIGLALAAAHLLPCLEVAFHTTRAHASVRIAATPDEALIPLDLAGFLGPTLPRALGIAESVPGYLGHEKALYLGLAPLLLAGFALVRDRRGPVLFFAAAAGVALMDAAARHLPLHALLSFLPGNGAFRVPARSAWIAVLGLSVMAGFGVQALASRMDLRRALAAGAGAALLAAADLVTHGLLQLRRVPREVYTAPPWYAKHIGPERADYRLLDLTRVEAEPIAHGFRLLRGCGYPILAELEEFYSHAWEHYGTQHPNSLGRSPRLKNVGRLRSLAVRWIVAAEPPLHPDWRRIASAGDLFLYEDPNSATTEQPFLGRAHSALRSSSMRRTGFLVTAVGALGLAGLIFMAAIKKAPPKVDRTTA
jgi:hypothetical protein